MAEPVVTSNNLGASFSLPMPRIEDPSKRLVITIAIDNGSGAAPADAPIGVWRILSSPDKKAFLPVLYADADLAKLAPAGNVVVGGTLIFVGMPRGDCRLVYTRTSGGGTSSVCSAWAVVE